MEKEQIVVERYKQGLCPICKVKLDTEKADTYKLIDDKIFGLVAICAGHTVKEVSIV